MVNNKGWMGFLALGPFLAGIGIAITYFFFIFTLIGDAEQLDNMPEEETVQYVFGSLAPLIILIVVTVALSFLALIFYIIHAVRNPRLQGNSAQIAWIIAFIFTSHLGILVYWIVEIIGRKDEPLQNDRPTIES